MIEGAITIASLIGILGTLLGLWLGYRLQAASAARTRKRRAALVGEVIRRELDEARSLLRVLSTEGMAFRPIPMAVTRECRQIAIDVLEAPAVFELLRYLREAELFQEERSRGMTVDGIQDRSTELLVTLEALACRLPSQKE